MVALVRRHRPRLRLVDRHRVGWLRAIGWLVRPVAPDLDERFTTVIGDAVYLPCPVASIDRDRLAAILAHELVHQLDQARYGVWFYVSYAAFLPVFRTQRAGWERRAYLVDLLIAYERFGEPGVQRTLEQLVGLFAGPAYGFMWVGRAAARRYLAPTVAEVLDGSAVERQPYCEIVAAWRGEPGSSQE